MNKFIYVTFLVSSMICQLLSAEYCFPVYAGYEQVTILPVNDLTLSGSYSKAEIKQNSISEKGWLYGIRGNYDIISPQSLYLGAEVGYKFGDLKGYTTIKTEMIALEQGHSEFKVIRELNKKSSKSKYTDAWGDVKFGYTFGLPQSYFCPYVALGYEKETQNFSLPLQIKYKLTYGYLGCGLISKFMINNNFSVGLNAKLKWMFNSKSQTNSNEIAKDKSLSAGNKFHYEVEVPLGFQIFQNSIFSVTPFYQYKNYDRIGIDWTGSEKTSLSSWGGMLQYIYLY